MFMFKQRYVLLIPFLTLSVEDIRCVSANNCSTHDDCNYHSNIQYCCTISFSPLTKNCQENCLRNRCISKWDCGEKECCSYSNICTLCEGDFDCRRSLVCDKMLPYCCKQRYRSQPSVCKANCTGEPCDRDWDCASEECCSRSHECTTDKAICLDVCNSNANCLNDVQPYCCGHRYKRRLCSNTCVGWECRSNSDCGGPGECCVDSKCTKSECIDEISSLKIVIVLASVVVFAVLCAVLIATCYYRRRGRCVLFKSRTREERTRQIRNREENIELRNSQLHHELGDNFPPPPYSTHDQPFPPSQNQEFPPIYKLQDTPT